jgi:SAM-dependent methyltransferase
MQAGVVRSAVCTDVSPGMLDALAANAARLGVEVETVACEAARLPFPDDAFDLVLGHAVLHHLPDLDAAFAEFHRVLRPGGVVLFAGEPSRLGDRVARVPKRAAVALGPLWRRAMRARPAPYARGTGPTGDHALEDLVDVHAFAPGDLAGPARRAGFADVQVRGEELLASWFGWFNRTLEASGHPDDLRRAWVQYAYRGYLLLQRMDRAVLEPHLPAAGFYNLLLCARVTR